MNSEHFRYSRLLSVDGIGESGVKRLIDARVLVIGCGALGSLCSMYLAASGIGSLTIADFDTVDISNLQRQLFFRESDAGLKKSIILGDRIRQLNSDVHLEVLDKLVDRDFALGKFSEYDFIIDGSDNPATKLLTDEACFCTGVATSIGGVSGFSGQIMSWKPGAVRFSSVFGELSCGHNMLPCQVTGVIGPAAGVIASIQAAECIKFITGAGECLFDKVLFFDMRNNGYQVLDVS